VLGAPGKCCAAMKRTSMPRARRIPDPKRRRLLPPLRPVRIFRLQAIFQRHAIEVWQQQHNRSSRKPSRRRWHDGGTSGECKQGMDINHKGQWGILLWFCRWPTRASRSSSSSQRQSASHGKPPAISTRRSPCVAGAGFQKIRCERHRFSRRPNTWTAGTLET